MTDRTIKINTMKTEATRGSEAHQTVSSHVIGTMVIGNIAAVPVTSLARDSLSVLREQEVEMDAFLRGDTHAQDGLEAKLTSLMTAGLAAYEQDRLSDEELTHVGNLGLRVLSEVCDQKLAQTQGLRKPGGLTGFEQAVPQVARVFERLEGRPHADLADKVSRTLVLLRFASNVRDILHKDFVDIHSEHLLARKDSSSEMAALWQSSDFLELMALRIERNAKQYKVPVYQWPEKERKLVDKTLEAFGFSRERQHPPFRLFDAWDSFSGSTKKEKKNPNEGRLGSMAKAIKVMAQLTTGGLEVPLEVHRRFGIRHFGRYKAETLYKQLEYFRQAAGKSHETVQASEPMRLVIVGAGDWNNALAIPEADFGAIDPIYMEAATLGEVARALVKTKKVAPISSLIISAHGSKHHLSLGHNMPDNDRPALTTDRVLESKAIARLKDKGMFTPDADIILVSCSTGKDGGIGQTISQVSGIHVVAPRQNASGYIRKVAGRKEQHRVEFTGSLGSVLLKGYSLGVVDLVGASYRNGGVKRNRSVNLYD